MFIKKLPNEIKETEIFRNSIEEIFKGYNL